jgi:hypothetical protein
MHAHSWLNLSVHIFRTDGRVWRARIGHAILDDGVVALQAEFKDEGKKKKKLVLPSSIAALQVLWVNVDVVSEDEGPETTFNPTRECDRLPRLTVETKLSAANGAQLAAANTFVTMTTPDHHRKPRRRRKRVS